MGLIDIIKENGKRVRGLALAGALGSSLYLSGCIVHGGPREMSNFVFRDIMGFPGMKDKDKENQNQIASQGNNQGGNGQNNSSNNYDGSIGNSNSQSGYDRDMAASNQLERAHPAILNTSFGKLKRQGWLVLSGPHCAEIRYTNESGRSFYRGITPVRVMQGGYSVGIFIMMDENGNPLTGPNTGKKYKRIAHPKAIHELYEDADGSLYKWDGSKVDQFVCPCFDE